MSSSDRPYPVATPDSGPFWEFAAAHDLRVPRCTSCGRLRYPPTALCSGCLCGEADWVPLSGAATLKSWAVVHEAFVPGIPPPYYPAEVELVEQEGLTMVTQLFDVVESELQLGMAVRLSWLESEDGPALPLFRPEGEP